MGQAGYAPGSHPAAADDAAKLPSDFDRKTLRRRALQATALFVVVFAIALLAPGLGQVRDYFSEANPGWLALALVLEGASFGSYIVMFRPIFCRGMGWRRAWQ